VGFSGPREVLHDDVAWDKLAYTHRKEHVRSVVDAKRAETRTRRIAGVVTKLERSD
jgi:uncharacterized protein YdeI (YjbR/CyaY-like superfamily)